MILTDDFVLKCMSGEAIFFKDVCAIYSPTLRKIVSTGYDTFLQYISILNMSKPTEDFGEITELIKNFSDFEYIIFLANVDQSFNLKLKELFRFFTHESTIFSSTPPQIVFGPIEEKHLMGEEDFYEFRRIIRRMLFLDIDKEEIIINENDSPHVRKLKEQMRKNREKVAKAKAKKNQSSSSDGVSFSDLLASITINNCGLNMNNIWDITYYAFQDQLKRMGWRDKFNINNQAAIAGAKIKKKDLSHWIKKISSDDKSN